MSNKKLHDQILKYIENEKEAPKPSDSLKATLEKARNKAKEKGLFITESNIEAYIRGDLDAVECTIIENRMATDPEFAAKVAMEQAIVTGIREYAAEQESLQREAKKQVGQQDQLTQDKGKIIEVASNVPQTVTRSFTINTRKWLLAATLALLLGAILFFNRQPDLQIHTLVQQEIELLHARDANMAQGYSSSNFDYANQLIDEGKYQEARKLILDLPEIKRSFELKYLLGMILLYSNDYSGALQNFEEIMQEPYVADDFIIKSTYSAALCQIGLNNKKKALEYLDKVIAIKPVFQDYVEKAQLLKIQLQH